MGDRTKNDIAGFLVKFKKGFSSLPYSQNNGYRNVGIKVMLKLLFYGEDSRKIYCVQHFYVPLGVGVHLEAWGIPSEKITEMDWWQETQFETLKYSKRYYDCPLFTRTNLNKNYLVEFEHF
ncbi:hypothetical protein LX95_00744 [Mesonia algae]|uniref:Uncharacterized protein n=1 Tax=Mesonia algae TaxID=213248 RepID=A0A2W7IUT1_9FLAO|nr:hypothetical protein [Mesonia algae]PZW42433.1 hypothetical protein LX95_00744 [Mesonia algae]